MEGYTYHIALGANLNDRERHLRAALAAVARLPGTRVERVSSVYETEPVGVADQPKFLNAAAEVRSSLSPHVLLGALLGVEAALGRRRGVRYGPRRIDLDILLCGEEEIDDPPCLIIPHPRMRERAFALVPLAEIAPAARDPVSGRTIRELCGEVGGKESVTWCPTRLQDGCGPTASSST